MVKRVCRSGVAVTLMLVLLFTTFASLFVFTNEDAQGADNLVSYNVMSSANSYGLGGVYGYKYRAQANIKAEYNPVHDMFCLQPSRAGWENGSVLYDNAYFQILDKTGIDKSKRELMYKAVYYGYKGAGWNIRDSKGNYVWQKKIDDIMAKHKVTSANTTDMTYYLITHFVVSYIYNSSDDKFKSMSPGWLNVIKDLEAAYSGQAPVTDKMAIYVANIGNGTSKYKQTMIIAVYARRLRLKKVSSDTRFIKGQGINSSKVGAIKTSNDVLSSYDDYSGARIAMFKSRSLAEKAAKQTTQKAREAGSIRVFTTNKDGGCSEDHVVGAGDNDVDYYAVESKGPNSNSYAVSNTVYHFEKSNDYSSHIDGLPLWTVTIRDTPRGVNLRVTKASANPDMTKNNSNYSFEGAKFAIFTSKSTAEAAVKGKDVKTRTSGSLAIKITTDSKGVGVFKDSNGKTVKLPLLPSSQAYYAVEYVAPKGYELYNSVITFKKGDLSGTVYQYTATINETPKSDPIGVIARKKDAVQGTYDRKNLAGAIFEVKYYDVDPTTVNTRKKLQHEIDYNGQKVVRKWYFNTDDDGILRYDESYLVNVSQYKSDSLYTASNYNYLPIGAITVKEVKAPTSGLYEINPTTFFSTVTGTESDVKVDLNITVPEDRLTTGISVIKESDDGLVANIYFRVTSSDGKVNEIIKTDESGSSHLDGLDVYMPDGRTKIDYKTSELGLMVSGSDSDRQKATYKIPGRYKKPADQSTTLTPNKPSRIIFVNEIETGSIKIVKQAEDNSSDHNTVSNITFKVVDSSDSTKVYTVVTDTSGNATLSNLPIYNDDGNVIKYNVSELGVASTVQRNYIYGDVDFDGKVTAKDRMLILRYISNLVTFDDTQIKVADVNGDGKITETDSVCIQAYLSHSTDTSKIGKTNTVCSELGEGQFTEYSIPKRYEKQEDRTNISLTADQTFPVKFVNTILTGTVTIEKTVADDIADYDTSVANLWFNLTDGDEVNAYASTDSSGHATFADLPVYNDYDEKIVYTVTELGFKQTDGKYLYPAYYVAQEPKNVTIDEKTVNATTVYNGVAAFHNRFYTASLIVLKSFYPITENGVYAKFRLRSLTEGYSYDYVYTTSLHHFVGDGNQNGCIVNDIVPFLADGTSIEYEISEIAIVDSAGHKLPETYMSLLDSARISWTLDDFTNEKNDIYNKDKDKINIRTVYTIDNYYTTGHLNIYKTADDNDVSDIWFKIECANSLIETKYVKTDKTGHAELDKIVAGTVKDGQLTYTVTELGKLKTGSEDAPEKATFEIPSKYAKPKPKTFTFDAGEIEPDRTLAFSNKLYGSFRVHKVDNNGKAVANAKFQLINSSGKVVGVCTTQSNGYSNTISRLPQGTYTVKEISTPKGFYLLKNASMISIGTATVSGKYPWIGNDFVDGTKYVYGDVNLNGTVDAEDAVLVQKAIGGMVTFTELQKKIADVTKNGEIGADDATEIQKYAMQLNVTELNYTYNVTETEQPPFPPAGGMNLFGVVIASSLLLSALGSLMIVRRKAGK